MTTLKSGSAEQLFHVIRPYWLIVVACGALGMAGGASVAGLLAVVNRGLYAGPGEGASLLFAFAALCTLVLIGSISSDIGSNYVGQRIIASLRKALAEKILAAPIDQLERYRTHRLIPVLTQDVDAISNFAFLASSFVVSLTIAVGCLVYLAFLSWSLFLVTGLAIVCGSVAQAYARALGVRGFNAARDAEDELQKHYRAIAEGAKELRLNRARRQRIYAEQLRRTIDGISATQIRSINLFVTARAFGNTLFFVVIGLALALREVFWADSPVSVVSGFVLVLLYMRAPVDQMISILPALGRTQVAVRRIVDLSRHFSTPEPDLLAAAKEEMQGCKFSSLELRGVTYAFEAGEGEEAFALGPIDLHVRRGETVFIVGDNGSGKTTLIKLLLGLYAPQAGVVVRDGEAVGAADRDDYRQLFTTVFSDYFLFDDIAGLGATTGETERYLQRLELAHKVSVRDGTFTTIDLSTGQRKRLALMNAWLEGRPILVFDEWAADQDPAFRKVFYTELLPDLKKLGKTLIVISHDDRYFDVADRIVRLSQGRVV